MRKSTAALIAALVVVPCIAFSAGTHIAPELPKCTSEDVTNNCFGDPSVYGNGGGIAFINYDGALYRFVAKDGE